MRAWRVAKAKRATDLSGRGAAIEGGRWNEQDIAAVYMGLSPGICCLETFVHAEGPPAMPMKITCFELPDDADLYWEPAASELPEGWSALPVDRPSMDFGSAWLRAVSHLGLIVPSAVLPLERNLVVNPLHPAISRIRIVDTYDFTYDPRMFKA
ncbi:MULTISPECIES: RES family NAD+ phosphorylase [unclassified Pseudomonas]|uniref:RES family NAD+ phosphorylase n=1 Tax=unclassified Pseudomonas TaxID=196821 RepID=UPI001783EFBC|nr:MULTISPECIES: RES family NAD+ phosphorylase [unclassified Pseudomonas]MBD9398983.1 RES family NAD+ phosphorylase [Pseudomonas sp. PDM11]MBV7563184.1 RES family NAD+ phosphorylase [Pseudomonas sp. sia0905]MDD1506220.1 RES family NAD+ phosphorylase [Pseudomonas sp. CNPSo 3701]